MSTDRGLIRPTPDVGRTSRSAQAARRSYRWRPQRDTRRVGVLGLFRTLRTPINQANPGSASSRGRFRCTSIDPVIQPEREKSRDDRSRKVPRPYRPAVPVDARPEGIRERPAPGPRSTTVTRSPGRSCHSIAVVWRSLNTGGAEPASASRTGSESTRRRIAPDRPPMQDFQPPAF